MASGTITLSTSGQIQGRITWSSSSNGASANSSDVTATIQVRRTNSYATLGTWTGSLNIGGTTKEFSYYSSVANEWVTLLSFKVTKGHNTDGTGSCYISGNVRGPSGTSQASSNSTGSATVTLDLISRPSSVSSTSGNVGSQITITISRKASSFTHTLTYNFRGVTGTIATKTSNTSIKWTIPASFYELMPNSVESWATLYCDTYSDNTKIGTAETTFNVTVSESSSKPTITPTVKDSNATTIALTGDSNKLVRYYSNAAVTIGAAARNSATLISQKATNGSKSFATSSVTFNAIESGDFSFSATDSRGFTTTATVNKTVVPYVKLTCNIGRTTPDTSGNFDFLVAGNYFSGSFGAVSNTLSVQYRYKVDGGTFGAWQNMSATASGGTYTATAQLSGLDYQTSYIFQARATDKLATKATAETPIKAAPIFHWGAHDFVFECPVTINGELTVNTGGWQTAEITSDFSMYSEQQTLRYKKSGDVVTICGALKPASDNNDLGSTIHTLAFTLPDGYGPPANFVLLCQASGSDSFMMQISPSGEVLLSRYRTGATWKTPAASSWLPIGATYIVA